MATVDKEFKRRFFKIKNPLTANEKCPPQSKLILDTIAAAGGTMLREDLIAALKRPAEEGGLQTNQTAERILGFYKPKLITNNFLEEVVETYTEAVEVPDKPVKVKAEKVEAATAGHAGHTEGDGGSHPPAGTKEKGKKGEAKAA